MSTDSVHGQFEAFPFSADATFQHGLSSILTHESASHLSDDERAGLVLKTKVFYFNRVTGNNITLEDVEDGNRAQRTLSFAELKNLIEQGKTEDIPNNKVIADILNDELPSQSIAPVRKKPWEVAK